MRLFGSTPVRSFAFVVFFWLAVPAQAADDPLASWNDGPAKQAILDFVNATTTEGSPTYVPPEDRIATFDQDGTLWVSHPLYAQAMFALDRVHELAPKHPEWKKEEPFKAVLAGDRAAMANAFSSAVSGGRHRRRTSRRPRWS